MDWIKNINWEFWAAIVTVAGAAFWFKDIIRLIKSRYGNLKVELYFEKGRRVPVNKSYVEQFLFMKLSVFKTGHLEIFIDTVNLEVRNIDKSDSYQIDINEYIQFKKLQGVNIPRHGKKYDEFEFSVDKGLSSLLQIIEIRALISDTRGKKYYSNWITGSALEVFKDDPAK